MLRVTRTVLYITLAAAFSTAGFAQRGGGGIGPFAGQARGPSSTAFGAGATFGAARPSSTSIGAGGAIAPIGLRGATGGRGGFAGSNGFYGNRGAAGRGVYGNRGRGDYRNVPYPYFFSPYYYPFLDYGSAPYGSGFYGNAPEDMPYDPGPDPSVTAQNMLGDQVQRLTAEVEQMKYAQYTQQQGPGLQGPVGFPQQPPEPAPPALTVVLRNGQKLQVQNYAVMDHTFWDFSKQPARKIPIANIDVSASSEATAANGGEFPPLDIK